MVLSGRRQKIRRICDPPNQERTSVIKTKELDYHLPPELIAQKPCEPRDAARLMIVDRETGEIRHGVFRDFPGFIRAEDCLVLNRTAVVPAKFVVHRPTGGRLRGLFVHERAPGEWTVLLSGAGRVKAGERLRFETEPPAWMTIIARGERGSCEVRVNPPEPAYRLLDQVGTAPLPPYIRREVDASTELNEYDRQQYQTVYADAPGAIAAPTAGMHFTPEMLAVIREEIGATVANVVLHVGLGTFQPVEVEDLADHPMHSEWYDLTGEEVGRISAARRKGGRIVAVGTTSVRVLETCAASGELKAGSAWTDILIYPPYTFQATDVLLTNFHLPGSTLLALVSAFTGCELMREAYAKAVEERYRFFSYGDAMLIL